jgi:pyruvate formate lyase activating enzyme
MKIGGITPFTTIDFPGALAAVFFCQGCPWRCSYCHNPHLQSCSGDGAYTWDQIVSFLKMRQGFLEAIVLSGGEPTLQKDLPEAIKEIRSFGYQIGLHTAGMFPESLKKILPQIHWVGMDIKAPFALYEKITHVPKSGDAARTSARLILESGVPYEFRTTVHPDLLSGSDLLTLAGELIAMGAMHYVLQTFRKQGCANQDLTKAPLHIIWDETVIDNLKKSFQTFSIRD